MIWSSNPPDDGPAGNWPKLPQGSRGKPQYEYGGISMTLKELVRVLPVYTMVHVHDQGDSFACKGNPHEFTYGLYKSHGDDEVHLASPIASYTMEVTVKEAKG